MSQFQPTRVTFDPPPAPDYLAGAVLQGLSRPIGQRLSWGVIRSLLVSMLSFGVVPLVYWVRAFRLYAIAEQQQLLHLAHWLRANSDHPLARRLEEDAGELRTRTWLSVLAMLALVVTIACIGNQIRHSAYAPWDLLLAGTYGHGKTRVLDHPVRLMRGAAPIFKIWCAGLGVAYLVHWLQVQLHARDVKRFVARFSEIAHAEGVNRVKAESLGPAIRPLWMVAGVLMFGWGAPWGFAAMLAGAAQRRYITWTSRGTRSDVAQRLRAMLLRRRPSSGVPVPVFLRERCVEPKCRAEIPRGVNYCPRCGTRQKAQVNRLA